MIDINIRYTLVATQAALKHMKSGGRIIMIGSCMGERAIDARPHALLGHKGSSRDVHSVVVQRGGEPGHHSQQYPAGSDRHGFESRGWRLGCAPEGQHSARPLRIC
jgi:NAD(P)-dependent dehydrogenase (short-subunit alcohol dehydrogenase family)